MEFVKHQFWIERTVEEAVLSSKEWTYEVSDGGI